MPYSYYGDLGHEYPSSSNGAIIGLCTGLLPSAAVSCSKTVGELLPVAVETVVLALRLGLCVLSVQKLVDAGNSTSPSWSALVSGISETEVLNKIQEFSSQQVSFHKEMKIVWNFRLLTVLGHPSFFPALCQRRFRKWGHCERSSKNARPVHPDKLAKGPQARQSSYSWPLPCRASI